MRDLASSIRRLTAIAVAVALLAASVQPALAATQTTEPYAQLLAQIDGGSVARATIVIVSHTVKVTLKDGSTQVVSYPSRQRKALVDRLAAHGVLVKFAKRAHQTHHTLRYVAAAIVALALIVGAFLLYASRRKKALAGNSALEVSAEPTAAER